MTTKERLHELVDELSELEADDALRTLIARRKKNVTDPKDTQPSDTVDEWGDLDTQTDATTAAVMRDLDEEEAAIGFSWEQRGAA